MTTNITRRAALLGAAASTTALAVPAAAQPPTPVEGDMDRVGRLMYELADALEELGEGQFIAIVPPTSEAEVTMQLTARRQWLSRYQSIGRREFEALEQYRVLSRKSVEAWQAFRANPRRRATQGDPAYVAFQHALDEANLAGAALLMVLAGVGQ